MYDDVASEVLISEEQIAYRVKALGEQITNDYTGHADEIVVVCVLTGAFMFCADLIKKINLPIKLEFVKVSSYGSGTESSGECEIQLDLRQSIEGKHVLVVEDIVDTGNTLDYLLKKFSEKGPSSLRLASLLHKPARTEVHVDIDYLGFEIEDKFVVGYGLDYAERYRELPYVGVLNAGQ